MGSVFEDLTNKFDGKPVLFVTLDMTNLTKKHHAMMLGSALGISQVMEQNPGTGFILLIDPKDKKVIKKLTSDMDASQMSDAIAAALPAS